MEPIRAQIDAYLIDWITRQPLRREWFFEERDGNCRLLGSFALRLSETIPIWRRAVAPVAEWVARAFWSTIRKPSAPIPTRLTQNNKREAKGAPPQLPIARVPSQQNVCAECGKPIDRKFKHCATCSLKHSTASLIEGAKLGRVVSHEAQAQHRRKETRHRQALERQNWNPTDQPSWLTEQVYSTKIQPRLTTATLSQIASVMGVSIPYAADVRKGQRRPHPRHWQALAKLVGAMDNY